MWETGGKFQGGCPAGWLDGWLAPPPPIFPQSVTPGSFYFWIVSKNRESAQLVCQAEPFLGNPGEKGAPIFSPQV